jgi:RNA polymerase sigma-70 factor (ECF subfamily)
MMAMMLDDADATDEELIGRAKGGDKEAFGALVERHYGFVHRIAWRLSGSRADAEDIAQDVCVKLGRTIRDYRGAGAFTTWLYAVTLNAVRDFTRKAARDTARAEAYGVHARTMDTGTDGPEMQAAALWLAVRKLPDKQRDAVLLVYGEGLTHATAAEAMAISEAMVSWHIHEAKKRLKVLVRQAQAGEV